MRDGTDQPVVQGLLLAAGRGSRMGRPKALVVAEDGEPWLQRSVRVLLDGGCGGVAVVLGAEADLARDLVPAGVRVVVADDWASGMAASLRAGLLVIEGSPAEVALVHLVDLPDVDADVVARVLSVADGPNVLARASFDGRPGHPVLVGRSHWPAIVESAVGDRGARDYLARVGATVVECGDLASGRDQDSPQPGTS